jgi:hypothetical protein
MDRNHQRAPRPRGFVWNGTQYRFRNGSFGGSSPSGGTNFVGMVKRKHGRFQTPVLAGSTPAADTTLSAPDGKASVSHTDKTRFDPGREYQFTRVFSSAGERLLDMQEAAGSSPARRTIHRPIAQW